MWKRLETFIKTRILKRWGTPSTKKRIWDAEFGEGKWKYLEKTDEDPIYLYLEKYARGGSILDLGCGSGNTGCELDFSKYTFYTGTDVSEVAIQQARERSKASQRDSRNEYVCADIESFVPAMKYDLILFRESIFYIATHRIKKVLDHYSEFLKDEGVIVVRMHDRKKYGKIVELIVSHFHVMEQYSVPASTGIILVFSTKLGNEGSQKAKWWAGGLKRGVVG